MTYVYIGIAGIVGTILRYALGLLTHSWWPNNLFPIGTLTVNLLGCFLLGWFSRWVLEKPQIPQRIRISITTGLIGSFTTFSTFSVENIELFRQGNYGYCVVYLVLSIVGGLIFVRLGMAMLCLQRGMTRHD